jgi:hypothetical protein
VLVTAFAVLTTIAWANPEFWGEWQHPISPWIPLGDLHPEIHLAENAALLASIPVWFVVTVFAVLYASTRAASEEKAGLVRTGRALGTLVVMPLIWIPVSELIVSPLGVLMGAFAVGTDVNPESDPWALLAVVLGFFGGLLGFLYAAAHAFLFNLSRLVGFGRILAALFALFITLVLLAPVVGMPYAIGDDLGIHDLSDEGGWGDDPKADDGAWESPAPPADPKFEAAPNEPADDFWGAADDGKSDRFERHDTRGNGETVITLTPEHFFPDDE